VAGQDESVDLARPAPHCLKSVSGRWDYFNNGGSLTFLAPQFVSGGWDNRSMKTKLASAMVVIGLLASSVAPASAIFGLSKCEKVKKKILSEEAIGKESWKEFDVMRDEYISDKKVTNGEVVSLFRLVNLVHKSDSIVYGIASENTSCFTSKMNAYIRNTQAETKRTFDEISKNLNKFDSKYSDQTNVDGYPYFKIYYLKYISLYEIKLNKN